MEYKISNPVFEVEDSVDLANLQTVLYQIGVKDQDMQLCESHGYSIEVYRTFTIAELQSIIDFVNA